MLSDEFVLFVKNYNSLYPKVRVSATSRPRGGVSCYLTIPGEEVLFGFDCTSEMQARGSIQLLTGAGEFKAMCDVQEML